MLLEPGDAHGVDLLAGPRGRRLAAAVLAFLSAASPRGIPHSGSGPARKPRFRVVRSS